jgi:sugar phosphate isomerase/epimerase
MPQNERRRNADARLRVCGDNYLTQFRFAANRFRFSGVAMLSLHTITTKPWNGAECLTKYAAAGISGVTFWRHNFATHSPADLGKMAAGLGIQVTGLARGGFFPAHSAANRLTALDDNRKAIAEARECGAPVLVLVCGAVPGIALEESRKMIADGIASLVPEARAAGVKLAIEPLHPMYAGDRSAIVTTAQANAVCDAIGSPPEVGIALDVYHTWWDPDLEREIRRTADAGRLFSFHICDWKTPVEDILNDRGLMGEGCIPIGKIHQWVRQAGFEGMSEVEIFSNRWWASDQDAWLKRIVEAGRPYAEMGTFSSR